MGVPYLYIGRWQGGCDPDYQNCQPKPPAFYWRSPTAPPDVSGRVLVAYLSYATGWADIYHRTDPDAQLKELLNTADAEFKLSNSKFLFLPVGFDFADPQENLMALVDRWNASDQHTALVMADPDSAFQYLATQNLPELNVDFNPIWQAFYDTRPAAKIADKESEYYLTAADKFRALLGKSAPDTWNLAAVNAHYDNIAGVSFDAVWNSSQRPRYTQALAVAQDALSRTVAEILAQLAAPVTVFNPTSRPRSEVVELTGDVPDANNLPQPVQRLDANDIVFQVQNVPPLGYSSLVGTQAPIDHPASAVLTANRVTLANGLVSLTLDGNHGGALSSLELANPSGGSRELLAAFGEDITYRDDKRTVYA